MKSSINGVSGSQLKDKMLETVEPQNVGLAMELACKISSCAILYVSELRHEFDSPRKVWRGQREQTCELFDVKYGHFGIVPFLPSLVAKSGR